MAITLSRLGTDWRQLTSQSLCTLKIVLNIASASKSLTAASVALLVRDNEKYPQFQWDATMSSVLPDDFMMSDDRYTESVAVEDMLSHRAGMPKYVPFVLALMY
ncbi:hypothetical protein F5Y18DRAFT_108769 [Xylariaceae sp. FL1019]|nr:hypothetical protein F5Y18DRAFT_108769 [Xylariaceae sp. FL1019]